MKCFSSTRIFSKVRESSGPRTIELFQPPDYLSRFVSWRTVVWHWRFPHFEHRNRNRLTTSANIASHPAIRAKTSGFAFRTWPHLHVRIKTYCPKSSESLVIESGGRGGIITDEVTASALWIARGYLEHCSHPAQT